MKNKPIFILLIAILIIISTVIVSADTRVITNSGNWKDVYSGMLYANLQGSTGYFLTSPRHATIIHYSIPETADEVQIINSRTNPYAAGFGTILQNNGVDNIVEITTNNANIELLDRLPEIDKFIILDDSYGYNSISVAPLAVLGEYYVLFADRTTIGQITNILDDRDVKEIILYGQVDREVKNAIEDYEPIIINTGDRFDNNIEIVKKYQKEYAEQNGAPRKQAILSNGEFIETSLMSGADPVLFIGFSNVPDQVRKYITDSELEVGTLVGNELIGTATFIRRQTGLSVFVKFGQGSRTPQTTIAQVEDLDRFPIPRYGLSLAIVSAVINTATNNLEITYQNKAPIGTFLQAVSLQLIDDNGPFTLPQERLGKEPEFVDANDFKTIIYELKDSEGGTIDLLGNDISALLTTIFGESPKSLEQTLIANLSVSEVTIIDSTEMDILDVSYSESGSKFLVKVKNIGNNTAYATIELLDIYVNGEYLIFSADSVEKLEPGETKVIEVATTMEEEDYSENEIVNVKLLYGEREMALTKIIQRPYPFKFAATNYLIVVVVVLVIILLLLIIFRKKCKNCGQKNALGKKVCKKCKQRL